jgi:hypothetical protein
MRLIFIVLLAANIIFFVYQMTNGPAPAVPIPSVEYKQNYGTLETIAEKNLKDKVSGKDKKKNASAAAQSQTSEGSGKCQLIGPFNELLHAEYLVERLSALEVASAIKNIEMVDGKNYWVYLKPEMSEKEALRRLNEIQQSKAIDSYIIPSGELANGISFGQFTTEEEAKAKATQVRAQGYAAEIKEVNKAHTEIWVEVQESAGQKISEERWPELLRDEKTLERRQNYCLGVAK